MSVNWEDKTSPARLKAHAAACASGEFDHTVPTWDIYCDLRDSVVWALLMTGFSPRSEWVITEKNWNEVFCRLQILERVFGCRRIYNNGSRASREVYYTPEEIRSLVGLRVNAGSKSDAEFKKLIMKELTTDADRKLDKCINPDPKADPYRWEKIYAPKEVAA